MGRNLRAGFTLLELMMAIAVIGVVLAVAIPGFSAFRLNNRMAGSANDLLAGFNAARSEAIKRQVPVGICTTATPAATPPICSGALAGGTGIGWVVWLDQNADGALGAAEQVLLRHATLDAALALTSNWQTVTYQATGFPVFSGPLAASDPAAILICDERNDDPNGAQYYKRVLTISRTGRPAIVKAIAEVDALAAIVPATCP